MGQSAYRCSKGEKEKLQEEKEKGEEKEGGRQIHRLRRV